MGTNNKQKPELMELARARQQGRKWGEMAGGEAIQTAVFYNALLRQEIPPDHAAIISGQYAAGLVAARK